jgi:hypothetical protein
MGLDTLKALLWTALIIMIYTLIKRVVEDYKRYKNIEKERFAHNSIHNHARISGVSNKSKLPDDYIVTCGGAAYCNGVLKKKTSNSGDVIIKGKSNHPNFTFTPQTNLSGSGCNF